MLVEFGGLPGAGKTTLSREVARRLGALWLRLDVIETSLVRAGLTKAETIGPAGYRLARDIAETNLNLGRTVIIDAVNPIEDTRRLWSDLAGHCLVPLRVVEVVCSDRNAHRRRVEQRASDIPGHAVPTWDQVLQREYEPWYEPRITVDTAFDDEAGGVKRILDYLGANSGG
jgi:predicted kinase